MNEKTKMMMKMILKKDDIARVGINGENSFSVDLHGLGTKDSMVLVNNLINLNRNACKITIIHGFNHGTALKEMINGRFENKRIANRNSVANNPGITILDCVAAL